MSRKKYSNELKAQIASECFENKTVTPEQWIARAVEQGLNCVAVTDHNTDAGIDAVIEAAHHRPITIFPGMENNVRFIRLSDY